MDYGKWKYAQRKKEQKSKAHRHETELKEIRIKTPKIGDHDLEIKIKHARDFLVRGDRVQFTLRFRGRELAHIDEGTKVFEQIKTALADVAKVDQDSRFEGRRITMTLAPASIRKPGSRRQAQAAKRPQGPGSAKARASSPGAASAGRGGATADLSAVIRNMRCHAPAAVGGSMPLQTAAGACRRRNMPPADKWMVCFRWIDIQRTQ